MSLFEFVVHEPNIDADAFIALDEPVVSYWPILGCWSAAHPRPAIKLREMRQIETLAQSALTSM